MPLQEKKKQDDPSTDHLGELCKAMTLAKDKDEMRIFLIDLCTPAELRALSERWSVARILDQGNSSYRKINEETGVSTTTIGRVARFLTNEPHQGYRIILDRLYKDTNCGTSKIRNCESEIRSHS